MTPKVVVLPAADRDLDEQADSYLEHKTPETAVRWYARTTNPFELLASQPGIGAVWEAGTPEAVGVRMWSVDGFERPIIFYRPVAGGIEVLRVIRGGRDIDLILGHD